MPQSQLKEKPTYRVLCLYSSFVHDADNQPSLMIQFAVHGEYKEKNHKTKTKTKSHPETSDRRCDQDRRLELRDEINVLDEDIFALVFI
jgi:hypothetical protein